jgi:hypothetical protein
MNDALLTAGNSSLSIVKLVFGNLTLLLSTGYHNFWKRRMAHGKKMVKNRLMINSGIEMYRHNTAGAVRVLIPKMLCVLSEIAQPAWEQWLVKLTVRYVIGRYRAARMDKKRE